MHPFEVLKQVEEIKFGMKNNCSVCDSDGKYTDVAKLCPMHSREIEIEMRKSCMLGDVNGLVKLIGEGATKNFINSIV